MKKALRKEGRSETEKSGFNVGVLVVMISTVAFITGCQQANGDILKKGIIEFDAASVKCKNTNSFPYTDVTSGSQIQEKMNCILKRFCLQARCRELVYQ